MASSNDALAVETRARSGSTHARRLRKAGKIPGILYGHATDAVPIALDARAFEDVLHSGHRNHLLTITIDGKSTDTALVREIQRDPVSRRVLHADLQRVGRSEAIASALRIVAIGTPAGVREFGGVLDIVMHEIEVTGPADQIPDHLEVDVSALGIREHVTAGDVQLPPGFTLETPADTVVASVEPPRTHEEEAAPAAEAGEVPTVGETKTEAES